MNEQILALKKRLPNRPWTKVYRELKDVDELLALGHSMSAVADALGMKPNSFYSALKVARCHAKEHGLYAPAQQAKPVQKPVQGQRQSVRQGATQQQQRKPEQTQQAHQQQNARRPNSKSNATTTREVKGNEL